MIYRKENRPLVTIEVVLQPISLQDLPTSDSMRCHYVYQHIELYCSSMTCQIAHHAGDTCSGKVKMNQMQPQSFETILSE